MFTSYGQMDRNVDESFYSCPLLPKIENNIIIREKNIIDMLVVQLLLLHKLFISYIHILTWTHHVLAFTVLAL